ncbi:unnamed protein product [Polarella glacialis]|uniref:Peptidyl-prolyl cis-trans isomerase n=1 Tax=Polarella glacialis TaxID=89957 RepID=A0A813G6R8_POLGL|nr:unnamed protein product [Polarella glacialis]CAE8620574.1 unnamed protein product [Polarella glacialis]
MAGLNPRVFFDMAIGRRAVGRLKFELYNDILPITSENFRCLCTGETGLGYWLRPRWYRDTKMHKIVPGFMCQGGDFNFGNGLMGEHSKRGLLSMANVGKKHTNNSQFFMTFAPTPWLDGKHVVFGQVVEGFDVLDAIEACGTEGGQPKQRVWVHGCGEENETLLRREALAAGYTEDPSEQARKMLQERAEAAAKFERPDPHQHIKEVSPVPDEVWKKAKAYRDNML